MKNFTQPGHVLTVAAAAATVLSGQVAIVGTHIGIASNGATAGQPYEVALTGVYTVNKTAGAAWTQGQPLMWDASANSFAAVATPASGDITSAGLTAYVAAASGDTTGQVRFSGVPGTYTA